MKIFEDIINKYQEIVGQFLMVKPILIRIKNHITAKRKNLEILQDIEKMLIEYETLFNKLTNILDSVSKIKKGLTKDVNLTKLTTDFISFSSSANKMIEKTFKYELIVFGKSNLRPTTIIPSWLFLILGIGVGLWLRKK